MALLETESLEDITPGRLWAGLSEETRGQAARALYDRRWEDSTTKREANLAIAGALRFREQAVRKMPVDKRVHYLLRAVAPSESLAASLLMALHLVERKAMLECFLDALGIPQSDGVILENAPIDVSDPEKVTAAVDDLRERFPADHVDLYLASLVAMDPELWSPVAELVRARSG